jgi:hypothetical protein
MTWTEFYDQLDDETKDRILRELLEYDLILGRDGFIRFSEGEGPDAGGGFSTPPGFYWEATGEYLGEDNE